MVALKQLDSLVGLVFDQPSNLRQLFTHTSGSTAAFDSLENLGEQLFQFCLRIPEVNSNVLQGLRLLFQLIVLPNAINVLQLSHLHGQLIIQSLRLCLVEGTDPLNAAVHGGRS